jgi:hypothetical protein
VARAVGACSDCHGTGRLDLTEEERAILAAALGASRAVVPDLDPAAAAAALDPTAPLPVLPPQIKEPEDLWDPTNFAENGHAHLAAGWDELIDRTSPEAHARCQQARYAMVCLFPQLRTSGLRHPWTDMQGAQTEMWLDAFAAGLRAGGHYESLRLSLLGPSLPCRACWGVGLLGPNGEHYPEAEARDCADCRGRGYVPTPGVRKASRP